MDKIEVVKDPIAERLDELADLSEYWKKNRDKGRNPQGIRLAMIHLANELVILTRGANAKSHTDTN